MQWIGKIAGAHGLHGEIRFRHRLVKSTRFKTWDCIRVELHPESYIPFFISSIKPLNEDECICKFEEVHSREEAAALSGKNLYSSINYTVESKPEQDLQQYVGFEIYENGQALGSITATMGDHRHALFVLEREGKEILIPSQPELILETDRVRKILHMQLPEGLLELNS